MSGLVNTALLSTREVSLLILESVVCLMAFLEPKEGKVMEAKTSVAIPPLAALPAGHFPISSPTGKGQEPA